MRYSLRDEFYCAALHIQSPVAFNARSEFNDISDLYTIEKQCICKTLYIHIRIYLKGVPALIKVLGEVLKE